MLISRLRLITFDVTDTLLKFRLVPGQKYEEIGTMYGILCDKASLSSNFKIHWRKMNKEHPNFGLHSGLGWESWWKILVEGSFQDTLLTLKDKQLEAAAEHLIKAYKTSSCWEQCHGTSGLLSYIRSKGIPMGIVSNYDPRLNELLANMKLGHFFQFVLISYEAGFEKPDKRIFEGAMSKSKLKQLKPEECLHVGDKVLLDYEGAKKCGWNAALVNSDLKKVVQDHPDINPSHVFESLFHLHKHFVETSNEKISSQSL